MALNEQELGVLHNRFHQTVAQLSIEKARAIMLIEEAYSLADRIQIEVEDQSWR